MKKLIQIKWIVILFLFVNLTNNINSQTNFIYGKQFGSDMDGISYNQVADKHGNVYIAGDTKGAISGQNLGKTDGFITKVDSLGNIIWTKQFGTSEDDKINWLAIDKNDNLYATGYTKGVLSDKNFGNEDIMVIKLDSDGKVEWQTQFGTDSTDVGTKIYIDPQDNIFISGSTNGSMDNLSLGKTDCIIMKLNNKGNKIWIKQFGSTGNDVCNGLTKDNASNIYVCGYTGGSLATQNIGKRDAFIGKFTDNGEQIKLFQFGTINMDLASGIVVDNEKYIYVGGYTMGNYGGVPQGEGDSFLSKFNENFELIWTQQFGTNKWDGINGIALNEKISDNIVVSGCQNWPSCQSFIRMYKKDGSLLWVNNYKANGKNGGTCGQGVCLDDKGNIYHSGNTGGNLFKSINKAEGHDIFLIKLCID